MQPNHLRRARSTVTHAFRAATLDDADAVADVYLRSRRELLPFAPLAHSDEDVRAWISRHLIPSGQTTVAVIDGQVVGFLSVSKGADCSWIDQLYLLPACVGRGIGTQLLERARNKLAPPIRLYTFQANLHARLFYERRGFKAVAFGDGVKRRLKLPFESSAKVPVILVVPGSELQIVKRIEDSKLRKGLAELGSRRLQS